MITYREYLERLNFKCRNALRKCTLEDVLEENENYAAWYRACHEFTAFASYMARAGISPDEAFEDDPLQLY
jgi:hypothetical protein